MNFDWDVLVAAANDAMKRAYAPYSTLQPVTNRPSVTRAAAG